MQKITTSHLGVPHRLWIDDLSQLVRGFHQAVVNMLAACLIATFEQMQELGFSIADKSVVVCAKIGDSRAIARKVRQT